MAGQVGLVASCWSQSRKKKKSLEGKKTLYDTVFD